MRKSKRSSAWAVTSVAAAVVLYCSPVSAQFTFVNIADTTDAAPIGNFDSFIDASVNGGVASFQANYAAQHGMFKGSGGGTTTIVKRGDAAPSGLFTSLSNSSRADSSTIFRGAYGAGSANGIFTGDGGALTPVVISGDAAPVGVFVLIGSGTLSGPTAAFAAAYDNGNLRSVFTKTGGVLTTIATTGDPAPLGTFNTFSDPVIDGGTVAFQGTYQTSNRGIFTSSTAGGGLTTVAKVGDPAPVGTFSDFNEPSISDGTAAFRGFYGSDRGIFAGNGAGPLITIAKAGDPAPVGVFDPLNFDRFPTISNGTVAFSATYDFFSKHGIFIGDGGALTTVIKTGDPLFGSTLLEADVTSFGFDPQGTQMLAFTYVLSNDRSGVAVVTVPEPAALALLPAAPALLGRRRFRRTQI